MLALRCREFGESINIGLMLEKGLLHDVDESLTGDIPRPIKYYSDEVLKGIHNLANNSATRLVNNVLKLDEYNTNRVINNIFNCKNDIEGLFIRVADLLSVAYKAYEEVVMLGNKKFLKVTVESVIYLRHLEEYIDNSELLRTDKSKEYLRCLITDTINVLNNINDENLSIINNMKLSNYNFVRDNE